MKISFRHARLLFFIAVALCASASTAKADTVLYTDGPAKATDVDAWNINSGSQIEDSFHLSSTSTLSGITFGNAFVFDGITAYTVDWAIVASEGSQIPVCGDCSGTADLTGVFDLTSRSFFVYDETFSLPDITLPAGVYWLELQNENVSGEGGNAAYWDMNGGPSDAWFSYVGDVTGEDCTTKTNEPVGSCSNPFTIYGTTGTAATPEPSSLALLGSAALLLGAEIRRRYRAIG